MKKIGKITNYNLQFGSIKDENGNEYILLKQNILENFELKNNDVVTFNTEVKKIDEDIGDLKIATLVKKFDYKKSNN